MLSNSQGGLSEAQFKELETKGSADLGDGVGPLIGCLAKEYQQVHWYLVPGTHKSCEVKSKCTKNYKNGKSLTF